MEFYVLDWYFTQRIVVLLLFSKEEQNGILHPLSFSDFISLVHFDIDWYF